MISTIGPITYLKVFGQGIVIVNSRETIREMLESKSSIYSDRFVSPLIRPSFFNHILPLLMCLDIYRPKLVFGQLVGVNGIITFHQFAEDRFRDARKMMASFMGSRRVLQRFHPNLEHEGHKFLKRICYDQDNLYLHARK